MLTHMRSSASMNHMGTGFPLSGSSSLLYYISKEQTSELSVEDLGGHVANALADISVVHTILEGHTLSDALHEAGAVRNEETHSS